MLTPTDFHLALEAVVAYVDCELSPAAQARATAHLDACAQCAADVAVQRTVKTWLASSAGPELSDSMLTRLRQIPFTTDLQPPGMALAMHGDQLLWSRRDRAVGAAVEPVTSPPAADQAPPGPVYGAGQAGVAPPDRRLPGRPEGPTRPENRSPARSSVRLRRLRRGLFGAVAGLTAGVLATAAVPVAVSGAGTAQSRFVQQRATVSDTSSALFTSLDEAMAPRDFSGAATGLR